jgi:O-antigen/teichoic acid export membrane protein
MDDNLSSQSTERSQFKALWDFVFLSGGETIGKVAGFVAFAYLARTLDSDSYGAAELAMAMLAIFGLIVNFGFGPIGAREVSRNHETAGYWAALISGARLLAVILCIPMMCLIASFMDIPAEHTQLIWIISFALLAMIWNQGWLLQGLERMALVSLNQALRMIVFAIGIFLFVKSDDDLLKVGVVELVAALMMAGFFLILQKRVGVKLGISFNFGEIKQLVKRASSIGFSNTVWALNQYFLIILVAYLVGGAAVAWFAAAHRIVNALTGYSLVYHFNLFPAASARLMRSTSSYLKLVNSSAKVTAWGGVAVALSGTLLAEPLCVFIYGSDFSQASLSLAVLIWSVPLTLMSGHGRWALIATENQRHVLTAQVGGMVTTVVSGMLFIPSYGPVGASASMLLSHLVVWVIAHHFACKEVCQIPALKIMIFPVLLATLSAAIVYASTGFSVLGAIGGLLFYSIGALLLDRQLIPDVRQLARIKNELESPRLQETSID